MTRCALTWSPPLTAALIASTWNLPHALAAPEICERVSSTADDHTCLHGSHGPFASTGSVPHPGETPIHNVNIPHTLYTVSLSGELGENQSAVLYFPAVSGPFAFYMDRPYPFTIVEQGGEPLPLRLEQDVPACSEYFGWLKVYELTAGNIYWLVLGPTTDEDYVQVVMEYLPQYQVTLYPDEDGDGFGTAEGSVHSWCGMAPGYTLEPGDCDDTDPIIFPGASEICNGKDMSCSQAIDHGGDSLCQDDPDGPVCLGTLGCGWCRTADDCDGDPCSEGLCQRSEPDGAAESTGGMTSPGGAGGTSASAGSNAGGSLSAAGGQVGADEHPDKSTSSAGGCACRYVFGTPRGASGLWLGAGLGFWRLRRSLWRCA